MRRNPFAADQRPAPTSALEYFTNREGFLESFSRHAETPSGQDLSVLMFYGVGGIGKTTLIRKLCADLDKAAAPLPYARFNLENISDQAQAYRDVLLRLRSDLESDAHLKFPRFDLALAVLLASEGGQRPPLVKISPGLDLAFNMALELTPGLLKEGLKHAGKHVQTLIQKSQPLEHWVRSVGGTGAVLELSDKFAQDDQIIREELIRRFAQDLAAHLPERAAKTCRGVLFLDTYEALWTGRENSLSAQAQMRDDWVRLLAEYLLGAGVLLVIAGRDRLGWGDSDPEWAACLDQHLLGGVSAPDAQMFLARRGIGVLPPLQPDPLQSAILRCANTAAPGTPASCHLLALALSADIVLNTRLAGGEPAPELFQGMPPAQMTSELATRFLKSLHNRNLELWVEALSLTPRFDEAAALTLDAERHLHVGRAGWEQLCRYSFITAQPDGFFRLHRTMREVLRARSSEAVTCTLNNWYAHYWQERGEDSLAFYHHWSLNPEAELQTWADTHRAALTALHIGDARALLTRWAEVGLNEDDRPLLDAPLWARTHRVLGAALRVTPLSPRYAALLDSIQHFEAALSVFTEASSPADWAETQFQIGNAYLNLPTADRARSLRQAEGCFQAALCVWTEQDFPIKWAEAQSSLGMACAFRPTGDRTHNLLAASEFFQAATRVWTKSEYPLKWANMQNNLGCNFLLMPLGDHSENLRQAAACFESNQEIQTEDDFPEAWAKTNHNLGIVHFKLWELGHGEHLQKSITYLQAALRVHTEADLPDVWAETQNSLGSSFFALHEAALSEEASAQALQQAVECFEAAQRVWTEADNPDRWAQAQSNRGRAFAERTNGIRAEHLRAAIACFRDAMRVHTEEGFPDLWASAQKQLGIALRVLADLHAADAGLHNEAQRCFTAAARGFRAVGRSAEAEEVENLAAAPTQGKAV